MLSTPWVGEHDIHAFPNPETASTDYDGLLLIGGNLSPTTLVRAYTNGIFPWFEEDQPIMWWSPSIRAVIPTHEIHMSKSMAKLARKNTYSVYADRDFESTVYACSDRQETWITEDMQEAYLALHQQGIAHSIEVYNASDELVGGLYGVFVNNCFCGESMFSREANTSKIALITLAQFLAHYACPMIDCQMPTEHLASLGAREMPRIEFIQRLTQQSSNETLINTHWSTLWQHFSA